MLSLEKERQHYEQLRKTYIVDPNTTNGDGNESGVRKIVEHHPLSLDEASPWGQFFQDTELRRIIKQDVERTFPDNPYFRTPVTQERMTDILFVYCKIHNDVSYRQGMHELLAPILLVVDHDALDPEECTDAAEPEIAKQMAITLDKNFVEHDAFVLFSSVMGTAKQWYEFTEEPRRSSANRVQLVSPRSAKFEQRNEMANSSTPILRISHRIHHELLKTIDNDLYEHLEELAIEPQIYAIRWLRLLFGREFPLADVYCLWDALFADDRSLSAVEYVCIAMLLFIREELLSEDYSGCLHQLMRYPTISDITVFVKQAVHLRQNPTKEAGYDIRHRNAIREGKEEEWKEREAQRERARLQEIEKQQVQDPRQQIKREVSNVVGKIRDKVSIVASNVVAASSPTRLSSDPNTSPVMSHSSSHSDSNIHSILSSSAPHPRHATLSNSGGIPQRKSSHTSLNASVSLAQPKMGRIVARSIAIIERELYGNNHTEKQKTEEPKKIEEKEMKTPILLAKDEETDANNGTADKDEPDEETDGYRVPGTEEPSDESQDPQVQLIIALAGLKHVRDVLCGTAPEFDSTVLDNLEDDWVDLMEEKETAKTERLSMDNGQSGNVQESVGEDGGDMLSLSLSSTTQTNVDTLVGSAETSTDSKSPPNISQEPKEAAQTTKPAKEKPASSKETNKKKSIDLQKENAPTGKRTGKSTAITSPVRSPSI
ncbi:hypothetical protein BDF19DRAFT_226276 [Syncephalis fuscata]|nr:hypothetical protein BDF19DRAFT_226276 [Syncephalis fuscata]